MKKTKLLAIILMMIIIFKQSAVCAKLVDIGDTKYIERGEQGYYTIQYWNDAYQRWYYITYSRTYYTDNDGVKRIAYCCMPESNGVGWIPGEYEGYDTTIEYQLSNNDEKQRKLWRVFKNGYPNVSPDQLGVETEDDAYLATKQAAYFIIREWNEEDVYDYFRPGEDYVEGQEIEETKRRGQKVIDAIYKLVCDGNNDNEKINNITLQKIGDIKKEDEYSSQEYKIISNNLEDSITINGIDNCPKSTKIVDEKGEEKNSFNSGEVFKVIFKNSEIDKDYEILIRYTAICKNYPVFYAKSINENTQDYLLTVSKFDEKENEIKLKIDSKKCKIELKKIDEKTKEPLKGVKFRFEYKNGEMVGEYSTDEKGIIKIDNIKPGNIIVTEIEAPEGYVLNNKPREYVLIYNELTKIEINNQKDELEEKIMENKKVINKALPRTGF